MTGRDFKRFLSCHHFQIGQQDSKIVHQYLNGTAKERKDKLDYEQMKSIIQLKRSAATESLSKVKKINNASKTGKEESLLQQHRHAWVKYYKRINQQFKVTSEQFLTLLNKDIVNDGCDEILEFYGRFQELMADTESQGELFEKQTIEPIYDLCEDLKLWLNNINNNKSKKDQPENTIHIQDVIDSVKNQQHKIYSLLVDEEEELATSLEIDMSSLGLEKSDFKLPTVSTGVPANIIEFNCFDTELKCKVMEEFWNLDDSFVFQLTSLEEKYKVIRQKEPFHGWFGENHVRFLQISEQYPLEMPHRSKLFIDRVLRELPNKTRDDVVIHDDWCRLRTLFYTQLKETIISWQRRRDETVSGALLILQTSNDTWLLKEKEKIIHQKQKSICDALHNELSVLQKKREVSLNIELRDRKAKNDEDSNQLKLQMEKEKARRQANAQKLSKYKFQKAEQFAIEQHEELSRQEAFNAFKQKQKIEDCERVSFRRAKLQEKAAQQEQIRQEMLEKEKEKELQLEMLRQKVRVIAPADRNRVAQQTKASDAYRASIYETEKELQQPLFYLQSFSDNQVTSDKRLKVEQALRDAGVIQSDYARKILAKVNPPTKPRRDLSSNIFNQSDIR